MGLTDLNDDVLVLIISLLTAKDIISLRLVCRYSDSGLMQITNLIMIDAVWVETTVPCYYAKGSLSRVGTAEHNNCAFTVASICARLYIIPAKLLEALAIRTHFFDKNWDRCNPRPHYQ